MITWIRRALCRHEWQRVAHLDNTNLRLAVCVKCDTSLLYEA